MLARMSSRFARDPSEKSSRTRTSQPLSRSPWLKCEPMNPAPPVTNASPISPLPRHCEPCPSCISARHEAGFGKLGNHLGQYCCRKVVRNLLGGVLAACNGHLDSNERANGHSRPKALEKLHRLEFRKAVCA